MTSPEIHKTGSSRTAFADRAATIVLWTMALTVTAVFLWILGDVVIHGISGISWSFLTSPPSSLGREGGIGPIIVSTALILAVCLATAAPIGIGAAAFLGEFTRADSLFARVVRRCLDVLAGVPSIVFGLFGNAFFCVYLGMGFSILSGGLTLACMALPLLIRSAEEGFRSASQEYRLGAAALGMSRKSTLRYLLLPAAAPGLIVGLVLSIGRALAETAALIFTSGYVARTPESLFDSGRALSVHIFDLSMNVSGGDAQAYSSALVLVVMLLAINSLSSWLADRYLRRGVAAV